MKSKYVKKWGIGVFFLVFILSGMIFGNNGTNQMKEYEVITVNAGNWIIEAKEVATGNLVKLRFRPEIFVGQTFNFLMRDLKPGQLLSVQGPANAHLPATSLERKSDKRSRLRRDEKIRPSKSQSPPMTWEILQVDPNNWTVLARNRLNERRVKLKVHPEAFFGMRILIDNRSIEAGEGLNIVAPNRHAMKNCCTFLEEVDKKKVIQ